VATLPLLSTDAAGNPRPSPSPQLSAYGCFAAEQVVFWEMMHAMVACNATTEEELDRVEMLAPYALGTQGGDLEPGVKGSAEDSATRLRVQREGRHGIAFEFDEDENMVRAAPHEKVASLAL
jgi:hypothetical protein